MTSYVRYYSGEWSALYVDGGLVYFGDHIYVDEWIAKHLGIEEIHDNDDFLTFDNRMVRQTLQEVQARTKEREATERENAK